MKLSRSSSRRSISPTKAAQFARTLRRLSRSSSRLSISSDGVSSPTIATYFAATHISLSRCDAKEEKTQIDEASLSLFGMHRTVEPNLGEMFLNSGFFLFFSFLSDVGFDSCFFELRRNCGMVLLLMPTPIWG
ncbi:hypothetical protein AAC387_Pa11g0151 [Persea americana]